MAIRILLFLSSYTPLWIILGIRFWDSWAAWACFALGALGAFSLFSWVEWNKRQTPAEYTVQRVEDAGAEAAGYLASYLLPFFNVTTPTIRDVLVYIGFFVTAGAIFVRSSIIRINPTLYLAGYWVLEIEDKSGKHHYVITRKRVRPDDRFRAVDMRGGVLLLRSID